MKDLVVGSKLKAIKRTVLVTATVQTFWAFFLKQRVDLGAWFLQMCSS